MDICGCFEFKPSFYNGKLLFAYVTFSIFVEIFEKFLRAYIEKFKQQSIDSDQWKDFLYSYFPDKVHLNVCSGIYM